MCAACFSSAAQDPVSLTSRKRSEFLFVAADTTWRCEAAKVPDRKPNDIGLILLEAQGAPVTLLRTAFEARSVPMPCGVWSRGTSPVNEAFSVIPSARD